MIKVMKPMKPATTRPMPPLKTRSRMMPSRQAPQPMKMAEEYKLVTGGRPSKIHAEDQADGMDDKGQDQAAPTRCDASGSDKLIQKTQPKRRAAT